MLTTVFRIVRGQVQSIIDNRAQKMLDDLFKKMDTAKKPYASTNIGFGSPLKVRDEKASNHNP
jgi:hypothetical protein